MKVDVCTGKDKCMGRLIKGEVGCRPAPVNGQIDQSVDRCVYIWKWTGG